MVEAGSASAETLRLLLSSSLVGVLVWWSSVSESERVIAFSGVEPKLPFFGETFLELRRIELPVGVTLPGPDCFGVTHKFFHINMLCFGLFATPPGVFLF